MIEIVHQLRHWGMSPSKDRILPLNCMTQAHDEAALQAHEEIGCGPSDRSIQEGLRQFLGFWFQPKKHKCPWFFGWNKDEIN